MSQRADLSGIAGDDLTFTVTLTLDGSPLDLTGLTVHAVVKPRSTSADSDGTAYTLTVTDAASGTAAWVIPRADTAAPAWSWYRIWVADGSGDIGTALYGTLAVMAA